MTGFEDQVHRLAGCAVRLQIKGLDGFLWGSVRRCGFGRLRIRGPIGHGAAGRRMRERMRGEWLGGLYVRLSEIETIEIDPLMNPAPFRKVHYCMRYCACLVQSCGTAYIGGANRGEITGAEASALIFDEMGLEDDEVTAVHFSWETQGEISARVATVREAYATGAEAPRCDRTVFLPEDDYFAFPVKSTVFL